MNSLSVGTTRRYSETPPATSHYACICCALGAYRLLEYRARKTVNAYCILVAVCTRSFRSWHFRPKPVQGSISIEKVSIEDVLLGQNKDLKACLIVIET